MCIAGGIQWICNVTQQGALGGLTRVAFRQGLHKRSKRAPGETERGNSSQVKQAAINDCSRCTLGSSLFRLLVGCIRPSLPLHSVCCALLSDREQAADSDACCLSQSTAAADTMQGRLA